MFILRNLPSDRNMSADSRFLGSESWEYGSSGACRTPSRIRSPCRGTGIEHRPDRASRQRGHANGTLRTTRGRLPENVASSPRVRELVIEPERRSCDADRRGGYIPPLRAPTTSMKFHRSSRRLRFQIRPAGVLKHLMDFQFVWTRKRFLRQGPRSGMTLPKLLRSRPCHERFPRLPPGKDDIGVTWVDWTQYLVRDEAGHPIDEPCAIPEAGFKLVRKCGIDKETVCDCDHRLICASTK